jgi:hypothetical protein
VLLNALGGVGEGTVSREFLLDPAALLHRIGERAALKRGYSCCYRQRRNIIYIRKYQIMYKIGGAVSFLL